MIEMLSPNQRDILGYTILRNAIYSLNDFLSEELNKMEPFAYKQLKIESIMKAIAIFQEIKATEFPDVKEADNSKPWGEDA